MFFEKRRTRTFIIKALKLSALVFASIFAGAQFIRPSRTNPPVKPGQSIESHLHMTPDVAGILKRSCDDCHSNRTDWPWYSNVAPVSWFVIDHVDYGRSHLNFSEWAKFDDAEAGEMLDAICRLSKRGEMPLDSYTYIHRSARLSPTDVKTLCDWTDAEQRRATVGRTTQRLNSMPAP